MKPSALQLLAVVLGMIADLKVVALAIGFLVVVDVVTGVWASLKSGQKISSDRFSKTVTKSIVYLVALIVAHVAEVYLFADIPIVKVIAGFIASAELLSTYENLSRISGIDFRKAIGERLRPSQPPKDERGQKEEPPPSP